MKAIPDYELSYQFSAGAIDSSKGTITGATVAVAGVKALGKFVFLDKNGQLTRDEDLAVKKIPVYTDAKTLTTLRGAAQDAGGVLKIRSDHSDSLEARAGVADGFRLIDNRVTADLHLNDSYRDKDIVLETAMKNPKLIGLSIDMIPSFDIEDGKALMRIDQLLAVDIVDAGAITHEGLFLNRGVDKLPTINNPEQLNKMATENKPAEPTVADCMKAIGDLSAVVSKLVADIPKKDENVLKADLKGLTEQLSTQLSAKFDAEIVNMKKTSAALGLSAAGAAATPEDETAKALRLKAEKEAEAAKNVTFNQKKEQLVKDSNGKMSRSDAGAKLMREEPELYRKHLVALGTVRA